jgi:hypothetical protein
MLLIALAFVAAACGDDGEDGAERSAPEAEVYTAVIEALAPDTPGQVVEELDRDVFVGPLNDEVDLSLGVQASVVDDLEDFATIRFVDDKDEAVGSDETKPVIDDGVLLLLGRVPAGDSPAVRATRYVDVDDVARFRVTVEGSGERWDVTDIEPRRRGS